MHTKFMVYFFLVSVYPLSDNLSLWMHTKFIVDFFLVSVCPLSDNWFLCLFFLLYVLSLTISLSDCTQEITCQPAGALGLQPRKHCLVSTGGFVSLLASWFGLVRCVGVWGEFLGMGVWSVLLAGLILCKVWKGLVSYVCFVSQILNIYVHLPL